MLFNNVHNTFKVIWCWTYGKGNLLLPLHGILIPVRIANTTVLVIPLLKQCLQYEK